VIFDKRDKTVTKPRVVGKIKEHKCKMGRFEANNGGDEYCEDVGRMLKTEHGYHLNLSHKKAPTNMAKMSRIEQYAADIRKFYFLSPSARSEDYRKFMAEVESFSFTVKNLHDDAPDSLSMLFDYLSSGIKSVSVMKRPF
jgi:predicted phage terminase large subunit-like protein